MLIHKANLMFITNVNLKGSSLSLTLNNEIYKTIDNFEGPQFKCGRYCIVHKNSKQELVNLFLLDSFGKPFQVHGKNDVLLEGCVIYDYTKEITKEIAYATQLCVHSFNALFKNEIIDNKEVLLHLENNIFNFVLLNKVGWKSNKKQIIDLVNSTQLTTEIKSKINEALKIAPMPKIAIYKKPNIDLEEYPKTVFVRI